MMTGLYSRPTQLASIAPLRMWAERRYRAKPLSPILCVTGSGSGPRRVDTVGGADRDGTTLSWDRCFQSRMAVEFTARAKRPPPWSGQSEDPSQGLGGDATGSHHADRPVTVVTGGRAVSRRPSGVVRRVRPNLDPVPAGRHAAPRRTFPTVNEAKRRRQ